MRELWVLARGQKINKRRYHYKGIGVWGGAMEIEELDDIAEELADKLGIYGEERSLWVANFKRRVRETVKLEARIYESPAARDDGPIQENYNDSTEDVDKFNRSTGGGNW